MRNKHKIIVLLFPYIFLCSACHTHNDFKDFPMQDFVDYWPVREGDTIWYEVHSVNYPFVINKILTIYNEGDPTAYDCEFAEYSVEATNISSLNDTTFLSVGFYCYGRTRIRVDYSTRHSSLSITNTGFYNYANRSDLLFEEFPKDSLLLTECETGRIVGKIVRYKGLTSFVDSKVTYSLK